MNSSEALEYMAAVLNEYELKVLHLKAENARLREIVDTKTVELGLETMVAQRMQLRDALVKVIAHTGFPPHPTEDLLLGLLDSIQRIAQAALGKENNDGR